MGTHCADAIGRHLAQLRPGGVHDRPADSQEPRRPVTHPGRPPGWWLRPQVAPSSTAAGVTLSGRWPRPQGGVMTPPATTSARPPLRVSTPEELLAALPYLIGFHPRRSLVIVGFDDRRIVGVGRVDLPTESEQCASVAGIVMSALLREGRAQCVSVLVYEDIPGEGSEVMLEAQLLASGCALPVAFARFVQDDTCEDALVVEDPPDSGEVVLWRGPAHPRPSETEVPAVSAALDWLPPVHASRGDLELSICCTEDPAEAMAAFTRQRARTGTRAQGARAWGAYLTSSRSSPAVDLEQTASLVLALQDRDFRDALLGWLCPGILPEDAFDADLRALLRSALPFRPEVESDLPALLALVRRTPDAAGAAAADICAVAAQVAWVRGDGALAGILIERALRCSPGHRLAELLAQLVSLGVRASTVAKTAGQGARRPRRRVPRRGH